MKKLWPLTWICGNIPYACSPEQMLQHPYYVQTLSLYANMANNFNLLLTTFWISVSRICSRCQSTEINAFQPYDRTFKELLQEYTKITQPFTYIGSNEHYSKQHIKTTRLTVHFKTRQLKPDRYKTVNKYCRWELYAQYKVHGLLRCSRFIRKHNSMASLWRFP